MKTDHQDVLRGSNRVLGWQLTGGLQAGIHGLRGGGCQQKIKALVATQCSDWTQIAGIADSVSESRLHWASRFLSTTDIGHYLRQIQLLHSIVPYQNLPVQALKHVYS